MNKTKTNPDFARAMALISQCVALGIIKEEGDYIHVIYDPQDGSEERWVKMTKEDAAADLAAQNVFSTLETAIKKVKADTENLVKDCFEKKLLIEKDGKICSPYFSYIEYEEISWTSREELLQDLLYQPVWKGRVYTYNPRSKEYLRAWYEAYIKTEKEFPALHDVLFSCSDDDLLFSSDADDHAIYYFNPDSSAGGQIVHCPFDDDMARRIIDGEEWIDVVAECPQYLADINHGSFFDTIESLVDDYKDGKYIGNDQFPDMLKKIV